MKTKFLSVLSLSVLSIFLFTGCKTPAVTKAVVKSSVQFGVMLGVNEYPKAAPYLRIAAPIICVASTGTNVQPAHIVALLESNSEAIAAKNPESVLIFNSAFGIYESLYEAYGTDGVQNLPQLQAWLSGTCEGILEGLPANARARAVAGQLMPPHVRP